MPRVWTPCNRGSECTAFEIGSARYSSTRDPGYGTTRGGWGEGGGREAHRLSYNLCSHLKETLPGGTGSRIARTPRVWSYITSRPYLESFVTDSIGVAFGASSSLEERERLALKECCHLKVDFPLDFVVAVKDNPADSNALAFSE